MENKKSCKILELDSILQLLSKEATSKAGKEKALHITPSAGLFEANELLNRTNDAHMLVGRFGTPGFSVLEDIANPLRLAESGATLRMSDLLKIARALNTFRALLSWKSHSESVKTSLDMFFDKIYINKYLEDKITSCILSDEEMADNASKELANIRKKIRQSSDKARERLLTMTRSKSYSKYLQDSLITIRNGRFVVPVKEECRANVPGLVHDTSASGSTLFVEPMSVVEANNRINELKSMEKVEIENILRDLSQETGTFSDSIISSYNQVVELDLIFAKANLAYKMKASLPVLNDKGIIELHKSRHPLIDENKVVATDISLGKDFDTLVITGPNTGGKTVTLKTIGLLTLMAMCGLMIPAADNSKLSVFDKVFTDIGDEQSIEQSLSTFSSHMKNLIEIINYADSNSLILLDELGAGTDPVEGAALAMSILEELRLHGSKIAATTHYAELKSYALETNGVQNACCEFDIKTLRPTYKLLIGFPGRSNAFAISTRLGLDNTIVGRAKSHLSTDSSRFENVIDSLEKTRQDMQDKLENYEKLISENKLEKQRLKEKADRIDKEIESEIQKEREKAKTIVDKTIVKSQELVDELEALKKNKSTPDAKMKAKINKTLKELQDETDPIINSLSNDEYELPRELKVGDIVKIAGLDNLATIVNIKGNTAIVRSGTIKTKVNISELRLTNKKPKSLKPKGNVTRNIAQNNSDGKSTELDLRGMTSMEAIPEVDKFIDFALLRGIETITLIHGKGTGVLRREIQKYLKSHTAVKDFRLGTFGEGDSGVTIVNLK